MVRRMDENNGAGRELEFGVRVSAGVVETLMQLVEHCGSGCA
jgi:hypothetical protein